MVDSRAPCWRSRSIAVVASSLVRRSLDRRSWWMLTMVRSSRPAREQMRLMAESAMLGLGEVASFFRVESLMPEIQLDVIDEDMSAGKDVTPSSG